MNGKQGYSTKAIVAPASGRDMVIPANIEKNERHRLIKFCDWLDDNRRGWWQPDLTAYRDHLLTRLQPSSVKVHLSTIRAQYRRLLKQNRFIELQYAWAREQAPGATQADLYAMVNEMIRHIENQIDPENAPVKVVTIQDEEDDAHLRLTVAQANALLTTPLRTQTQKLRGLRDTAMIAVMLCTGIREMELCNLTVDDLRQQFGGKLALRVKMGKRAKKRMIPYGDMDWVLAVVDAWMKAAGITEEYVFRGFYKGNKRVRDGKLSTRAVERMLEDYPISVGGNLVNAQPHDLRRTYARRLWDSGLPIEAIQQNLGHDDVKTTMRYIGTLDAGQRSPGSVFSFDLSVLVA